MEKKQRIAVRPIAGGIKDSRNPLLLADGETPFSENVEFDRDSIKEVGGSVKFNNRPAPPAALRTVASIEPQPLTNVIGGANISVPMRGYAVIPYSREQDIGGQVFLDISGAGSDGYSSYRGRSFDLKVSFKIPDGTKLYGAGAGSSQSYYSNLNEAVGECFIIAQKGGDRFQPMSWALGVVNVGDDEVYDMVTGGSNFGESGSAYRLVFMWLDAPKFSFSDPGGAEDFRYELTDSIVAPTSYATLGFRSFVVDRAIEVGRDYHVSVSLSLDTGTVSAAGGAFATAWNDDGTVKVNVAEDYGLPTEYTYTTTGAGDAGTAVGLHSWTGPQDNLNYLTRYGIRYAGRDEVYLGLGFRYIPIIPGGGIPWGMDATALEHGGFSMNANAGVKTYMDATAAAVVGTCTHTSGNAYVEINNKHITSATVAATLDVWKNPFGHASNSGGVMQYSSWRGQGDGTTTYNAEALRGYHLVLSSSTQKRYMTIESYAEVVTFEFNCFSLTGSTDTWTATDYWLYPFRWHQRDLVISDFRIYAKEGAYSTDRERWGLHVAADLTDDNEPNIEHLVGYWPLDDGGGGVCQDLVGSNDAFFAPMVMGVSKRGIRGSNQVFLSGEGEAIVLDLSGNPIFEREFLENLRHDNMGVAVQVTCRLTGAEYSLQQIHPDPEDNDTPTNQLFGAWGGDIITWSVKDAAGSGMKSNPNPLLKFGYGGRSALNEQQRYRYPLGFSLEVADQHDQTGESMHDAVNAWGASNNWDVYNVPWAGRTITFQVGIQPGATAGKFIAYISGAPAGLLADPTTVEGSDPNGEYVLYTSEFVIDDKDLSRSVITIGGAWEPGAFGSQQTSVRMIVDEVRVFAASAPGSLPALSGGIVNDRSGKILGSHSLPLTELVERDLLLDLGLGVSQVDVTDGDATVKAVSILEFYGGDPEDTNESIEGAYLKVAQDTHMRREAEKLGVNQEEFYRVKTLTGSSTSASGKSELELHTPYEGQTVANIQAKAFRVVGYTAFADEFKDIGLPTSTGDGFDPSAAVVGDVVMSPPLWSNRAPVTGDWAVRLYSPLSGMSIHDVAPRWTGGFMEPRKNPIRGMHSLNDRLYAQAGASLFEVDDRWRTTRDGSESLAWLEFRAKDVGVDRLHAPLAGDRLVFTDMDEVALHRGTTDPGGVFKTRMMDFEVELNEVRGLQTVYQLLNENTPASKSAITNGWEMNHWLRFRDGQPQFVYGRSATYDGTNNPPRNLWVATADATVRAGERTHVRWIIEDENGANDFYLKPVCMVNGKKVNVTLSATENGAAGSQWVGNGGVVPTTDAATLLIGCSVDFYQEVVTSTTYVDGEIRGEYLRPDSHSGYLHSLNGKLRNLVIGNDDSFNAAANTSDTDYNFNWRDITYPTWTGADELANISLDEGVGHKAKEEAKDTYGVIYSHPFIELYSGMQRRDQHATFTAVGDQVYCTNGGRPVVIDQDFGARQAGLLPPRSAPGFEVDRLPLWEAQVSPDDPIYTSHTHKYSTRGNSYLLSQHHDEMAWESGDVWAFKGFVKMNSVGGRIPLYSARASLTSGGVFLDVVDGKCRLGWYDTVLKEEVYAETSTQVFYPGFWHYVYVRKNFPDGTWRNQITTDATDIAECNDMMVVRALQVSTIDPAEEDWRPNMFTGDATPNVTSQLCVSYTNGYVLANSKVTTASGLCSRDDTTFTGAAGGFLTANQATFTDDHIGRFFQADTAVHSTIYVIGGVGSSTVATLKNLDGATPNLTALIPIGTQGGAFMGAEIVLSSNFADSVTPDVTPYNVELFGSEMAAFPMSGVTPFNGSFASFGFAVTVSTDGKVFDSKDLTDEARTGTDGFSFHPGDGTEMGPLTFDGTNGDVFAAIQDSSPNEDLEVAQDAEASDNADALVWQNSSSIQMLQGFRRVRVTFFDTEQNVESNPGPELLIEPSLEDQANQSGAARIRVKDIPLSPQPGKIVRRVYMSLADGGVLFKVAELEDNVSDSIVIYKDEFSIGQGDVIFYDRNAPPECDVVRSGSGVMWYGGLKLQPNGVLFSRPFDPTSVPFSNFLLFDTGDNSPITGIHEHAGRILIFKRDAIFAATVLPGGVVQETVSLGAGSVNNNSIQQIDDRLYFIDSRGVQLMAPFGEPVRISEEVEQFFNVDWDLTQQKFVVGGLNRSREQYLFCTKETASDYPDVRYAAELSTRASSLVKDTRQVKHRYSRLIGPNTTAMATLWDRFGDNYKLVAGTEEGFAVWMDRTDTKLCMLGSDTGIWGRATQAIIATTLSDVIEVSTALDTDLSGPRGTRVRYRDSSGVEYTALALAAVGGTLILDKDRAASVVVGESAVLGATRPQYRTKWFDLGFPELDKKAGVLDISRNGDDSGTLTITTHKDFSATVVDTLTLKLTQPLGHLSTTPQGAVLQLRISEPYALAGTSFEIIDIVWRVQITDTW